MSAGRSSRSDRLPARGGRPDLDRLQSSGRARAERAATGPGGLAGGVHRRDGFAVVCPITSRVRPFPSSVVLPSGLPVEGEIMVAGIRSVDTLARPSAGVGAAAPRQTVEEVRAKLALIITI